MGAQALNRLRDELNNDPLVPPRGYSDMTDLQVSTDLQLVNRPGPGTVEQLRNYFLLERKGSGEFLYGRLATVAKSSVGDDPIGEATVLTLEHTTAAITMINILNPVSGFILDLNDTRFDALLNDLGGGQGCKVITGADKTAIQNMSLNARSRSQELSIPSSEGDVNYARNS